MNNDCSSSHKKALLGDVGLSQASCKLVIPALSRGPMIPTAPGLQTLRAGAPGGTSGPVLGSLSPSMELRGQISEITNFKVI